MKWIIKKSKFILPGVIVLTLTGMLVSLMGVFFALLSKRVLDVATGQAEGALMREGIMMSWTRRPGLTTILSVTMSAPTLSTCCPSPTTSWSVL